MILLTDEMISKAAHEVDMSILDMLPEPSDCNHLFSISFENKIKKIIRKAKYFVFYKVLKRVACIFIAIVLSVCTLVAFNPNARAAVIDWVKEKVGDFYYYFFVGESNSDNTVAIAPSEEGEIISKIEGAKEYSLSWVPEGYTFLNSFKVDNTTTCVYADKENLMLQFVYVCGSDNISLFVGGGDYVQKYSASGNFIAEVFLARTPEHSNAIVWKDDINGVIFTISAFADEEDLLKMAQNVIFIEKN